MHAQKRKSNPLLIVVILLLIAIIALLIVLLVLKPEERDHSGSAEIESTQTESNRRIGYAEGLTVVEDPDALQKAVDEMYQKASEPGITLEFKNDAFSSDGIVFDCYIANALQNSYDMYLQIFADENLENEIFLSGLVRPGEAFNKISLYRALDKGTHRVYVAFTQIEEVDGEQAIHAQTIFTMDFHVE